MSKTIAFVGVLTFALPVRADAQPIPTGVSLIDGYYGATFFQAGCTSNYLYDQVTGYLSNPGPGKIGTELEVHFDYSYSNGTFGAGTAIIVKGFPAQPPTGLNGWTAASPTSATEYQYLDGKLVQSSTVPVSFALTPISTRTSQGTITLGFSSCLAPIALNMTRAGP